MHWPSKLFIGANVLGVWLLVGYMVSRNVEAGGGIDGADLVTIVLTALAVMLAILTIFLASLAVWGYASIREAAGRIAAEVAERIAAEVAEKTAKETAAEVAARTSREIQDQESGQADGDEYADAASGENGQPPDGG